MIQYVPLALVLLALIIVLAVDMYRRVKHVEAHICPSVTPSLLGGD